MKDIYEVLRRKEQIVHEKHMELQQLEKEIDVLRAVVPMLREEADSSDARRVAMPTVTSSAAPKQPTMMASGGNGLAKGVQEPTSRWP